VNTTNVTVTVELTDDLGNVVCSASVPTGNNVHGSCNVAHDQLQGTLRGGAIRTSTSTHSTFLNEEANAASYVIFVHDDGGVLRPATYAADGTVWP
jgi:hypothetical protein